jgi:hypothetical protein
VASPTKCLIIIQKSKRVSQIFFEKCVILSLRIRIRIPTTSVADPDPGSGAFLTLDPGSGLGKKIEIRIRDEHFGSYFLELRNNFLG